MKKNKITFFAYLIIASILQVAIISTISNYKICEAGPGGPGMTYTYNLLDKQPGSASVTIGTVNVKGLPTPSGPAIYTTNSAPVPDYTVQGFVFCGYVEEGYSDLIFNEEGISNYTETGSSYQMHSFNYELIAKWEESSSPTAKSFATDFNSKIGAECFDGGGVSSNFPTVWASQATNFSKLSNDQKALFAKDTKTTDSDILACIEKYDTAFRKNYKSLSISDFMDRFSDDEENTLKNMESFGQPLIDITDGNNTPMIIIVMTLVGSAITIGTYFFVKKRRQD